MSETIEKITPETLKFFEGIGDSQFSAIESLLGRAISEETGTLKATQVKEIIPVNKWVNYTYYLGSLAKDLYPYWKEALPVYLDSKKPEIVVTGCFVGSSSVKLLDGRELTMKQLSELYPTPNTKFWVYSCTDWGQVIPGLASYCRKTGEKRELVLVELDNGNAERCTPDHLWQLRNGKYKMAKDLLQGDSLMPLYTTKSKVSVKDRAKEIGCSPSSIYRILSRHGYLASTPELISCGYLNHTVKSVRFLEEKEDVYDFTVEEHHNFALSSGVFVHNSIGAGKTTFAFVCWLRKLYELSCYDYPQRLFGLSDMTDIVFAYLSINMTHAERVGFGQFRSMVDAIPYFRKEFPRDRTYKSILKFPQRIAILPGSDNLSVISTNLFGCIMDEADFYRRGGSGASVGDAAKAAKIYREVTDRRMSRFMMRGYDPGFSAIISSASIQSSFVSSRIRQARQYNSATIFVTTLWDVKPGNYSPEKFYVFKGSENEDAFIITSVNGLIPMSSDAVRIKIIEFRDKMIADGKSVDTDKAVAEVMVKLPAKYIDNFVAVPMDFKQNFIDDVYGALRNIAGVSISPSGKLFSSKYAWQKCISSEIRHPFTKETFTISLKTTQHLVDYFLPELMFNKVIENGKASYKGLIRHPEALRYAHLDYATTHDTLGLAIVHIAEMIEDPNTMLRIPKLETDIVLSVMAPKSPDRISFTKIRKFIFELRQMGMRFGKISIDQFQSEDTIQIFTANSFNAARRSVDKDDSAYLQVVDLIYEDRLIMYNYSILEREFFNLNHFVESKKVDHPDVNDDGTRGDKGCCLTGDTEVFCLDGVYRRLDSIPKGSKVWVFSCTPDGDVVPSEAESLGVTIKNSEIVEVEIDNGEKVRVTPDHKFILRNGEEREARNLVFGDSLMPFNLKFSTRSGSVGYYEVEVPKLGYEKLVHSLVDEHFNGVKTKGGCVHHRDRNKLNNIPSNLQRMKVSEHYTLHTKKELDKRHGIISELRGLVNSGLLIKDAADKVGMSRYSAYRYLSVFNHSVVSVRKLPVLEDVYCVCVFGDNKNFGIRHGIFVHNSDALAGACFNAVEADPSYFAGRTNSEVVGDIVFTLGLRQEAGNDDSWVMPKRIDSKTGKGLKLVRVMDSGGYGGIDYGLFSSI